MNSRNLDLDASSGVIIAQFIKFSILQEPNQFWISSISYYYCSSDFNPKLCHITELLFKFNDRLMTLWVDGTLDWSIWNNQNTI